MLVTVVQYTGGVDCGINPVGNSVKGSVVVGCKK